MAKFLLIGLCEPPSPDKQAQFDEWFVNQHIEDTAHCPNFIRGRVYKLAGPLREASDAARKLDGQLSDIEDLLDDHADAPAEVRQQLDSLKVDLEVLRDELGDASRDARIGSRMDEATALPTADQEWQVEELWREVPDLFARLNEMIEERMPALNRMLDEHGIRPEVGETIVVPTRR